MGTLCKLDPTVRKARTDRIEIRRFFAQLIGHPDPTIDLASIAAHAKMVELKHDSRRTGTAKHAIVKRLCEEHKRNVDRVAAASETPPSAV